MDASSWRERERRFEKKFRAGKIHIPKLFAGMTLPPKIDQIALLGFAGKKHPAKCGGVQVVIIQELLHEILAKLQTVENYGVIPENYPILRTLQLVTDYANEVIAVLDQPGT